MASSDGHDSLEDPIDSVVQFQLLMEESQTESVSRPGDGAEVELRPHRGPPIQLSETQQDELNNRLSGDEDITFLCTVNAVVEMATEPSAVQKEEQEGRHVSGPFTAALAEKAFCVSPTKGRQRPRSAQPIATLVFLDLETTGLIEGMVRDFDARPSTAQEASNYLGQLIRSTSPNGFPRVLELTLMAVQRAHFEQGIALMKDKARKKREDESPVEPNASIAVPRCAAVHTRQLNPVFNEPQWATYATTRNGEKFPRCVLEAGGSFPEEWTRVREFLDSLPKPVALIAHNGITFDYPVLWGELQRWKLLAEESSTSVFPSEVFFVDSLFAFRELDRASRDEIHAVTKGICWKIVQEGLPRTRVLENIPAALNEEEEQNSVEDVTTEALKAIVSTSAAGIVIEELREVRSATRSQTLEIPKALPIGMTTPPRRPPPSHSSLSEPVEIRRRKRLFPDIQRDFHPLLYFETADWSPAKKKRVKQEHFFRHQDGSWEFNKHVAEADLKKRGTYSQTEIYKAIIGGTYNAHFSLTDCEALMQICMAYGAPFLKYLDERAALFPF